MSETYDKLNHWYGWNGGECPVQPQTEVRVVLANGEFLQRCASMFAWDYPDMPSTILAFKITRLVRKPREWWINVYEAGELDRDFAYESKREADENADPHRLECICFREVLSEADQ